MCAEGGYPMKLLVIAAMLVSVAYAQPAYRPISLNAPGDLGADARAVNDAGLAVVWVRDYEEGFWSAAWGEDLVPLLPLPGHSETYAEVANDAGQAVGCSKPWLWGESLAVVWSCLGGVPQVLPGAHLGGQARGVNELGRAVGFVAEESRYVPMFWDYPQGTHRTLAFLRDEHPSAQALAVNDAGQIVGWAANEGGVPRAVLWANVDAEPIELAPDTLWNSQAHGVNNSGAIVGGMDGAPFLWRAGELVMLPVAHGEVGAAGAINDTGQAVGYVYASGDGLYHAMLWEDGQGFRLEQCPGVGMPLAIARDINEHGVIACTTYDALGKLGAVLLRPIEHHPIYPR